MAKVSRGADQFMIRLPDGMREKIKEIADKNGRSMNAEIVSVLEREYMLDTGLRDPSVHMVEMNVSDEEFAEIMRQESKRAVEAAFRRVGAKFIKIPIEDEKKD